MLLFDDYYAYHYTFPKFPTGPEGDFWDYLTSACIKGQKSITAKEIFVLDVLQLTSLLQIYIINSKSYYIVVHFINQPHFIGSH